jgi:hypothetical protein
MIRALRRHRLDRERARLEKLGQPRPDFTPDTFVGAMGLISRFEWLRHHGDLATPPLFMAFDLLRSKSNCGQGLSPSWV